LSEIGVWNHGGHPNGVSQFSLRFAQTVFARNVEFTALDNYCIEARS